MTARQSPLTPGQPRLGLPSPGLPRPGLPKPGPRVAMETRETPESGTPTQAPDKRVTATRTRPMVLHRPATTRWSTGTSPTSTAAGESAIRAAMEGRVRSRPTARRWCAPTRCVPQQRAMTGYKMARRRGLTAVVRSALRVTMAHRARRAATAPVARATLASACLARTASPTRASRRPTAGAPAGVARTVRPAAMRATAPAALAIPVCASRAAMAR